MGLRLAASILALFASAAYAQVAGSGSPPVRQGSMTMNMGGTAFMGPVVTGAPYSATEVMEHTQTLADGTHITQKPRTTLMFRDSQGRTRTERPMFGGPYGGDGGPTMIQIQDPVAGFQYTLDQQDHVAHRVALTRPGGVGAGTGVARAMVSGTLTATLPPPPPARIAQSAAVSGGNGTEVNRPERSVEPLGTQTMEGVTVEGRRVTTTIPIGMQGNDRPIVSTTETWTSPDLKVMVLMKNSDPRNGENITRLTNITVGEPDPALFQSPADYTIVDEKGAFTIHYTAQ